MVSSYRHFWILLALLVAIPVVTAVLGQGFYLGLATRILIFGMAATALNLALGYGGMVSFGHAAFLGLGAYAVGVLADGGIRSLWIAWPAAVAVAALAALLIGAISLRTRGAYFIMITLAFAQMLYYLAVSLKAYGGDDGLALPGRSTGLPLGLQEAWVLYAVVAALSAGSLLLLQRLLASRFGQALCAIKENETRMEALGYPGFGLKLTGFVISGALAGLAGALLANLNSFVSPTLLHWQQSGLLMVMVIVGGTGRLYGGLVGAAIILGLEELLSGFTIHWKLGLGAAVIAVVLFAPHGVAGSFARRKRGEAKAVPAAPGQSNQAKESAA